jgi:hypothetical protein
LSSTELRGAGFDVSSAIISAWERRTLLFFYFFSLSQVCLHLSSALFSTGSWEHPNANNTKIILSLFGKFFYFTEVFRLNIPHYFSPLYVLFSIRPQTVANTDSEFKPVFSISQKHQFQLIHAISFSSPKNSSKKTPNHKQNSGNSTNPKTRQSRSPVSPSELKYLERTIHIFVIVREYSANLLDTI